LAQHMFRIAVAALLAIAWESGAGLLVPACA
jgi:hypothetical protein